MTTDTSPQDPRKEIIEAEQDHLLDGLDLETRESMDRNVHPGIFHPDTIKAFRDVTVQVLATLISALIIFAATYTYAHYGGQDQAPTDYKHQERPEQPGPEFPGPCPGSQNWRPFGESFEI